MDKLRDIKGLMVIDDYSLIIFISLVLGLLFLLYLIIKFLLKLLKKNTPMKVAKKKLRALDLHDAKQTAYLVSKYAPYINPDEDFSYLEKYKYKKENLEFLDEDKQKVERFLKDV